ncbi:MAG: GGDEF domain-containing protein [Thermodesulfobacteria bacterium]|nr:GGDEF domain-containing protein [Thermodesulfobacteriota bacterium]
MGKTRFVYRNECETGQWKETLKEICEVARICLHKLVATNTPPLPKYYEREFKHAAAAHGKTKVLELVVKGPDADSHEVRDVIEKASHEVRQVQDVLERFDKEARQELERMEAIGHSVEEGGDIESVVEAVRQFKEYGHDFVCDLSQAIHRISLQQNLLNELTAKIYEDPLTGVLNRRAWDRDLETLKNELCKENLHAFCIILADLDNFKEINDSYGHPVGDAVLRQFATILKKYFGDCGSVYRFGGDEFSLIVKGLGVKKVFCRVKNVQKRLANSVFVANDGAIRITVRASFGIAEGSCPDEILKVISLADEMLYQAKKCGRNCIKCVKG